MEREERLLDIFQSIKHLRNQGFTIIFLGECAICIQQLQKLVAETNITNVAASLISISIWCFYHNLKHIFSYLQHYVGNVHDQRVIIINN